MRSRRKLRRKASLILASFAGSASLLLILVFFFYDGPVQSPNLMPVALATEQGDSVEIPTVEPKTTPLVLPVLNPAHPAEWTTVLLDNATMKLHVLKAPLILADTTQQTGSEAFEYASSLYEQMARQVKDSTLAENLKKLSMETEVMSQNLRQASEIRFDGPPDEGMEHLRVRAEILRHLRQLNQGSLMTARYDEQGRLLGTAQEKGTPGNVLARYLAHVAQVQRLPAASAYPETMRVIRQESALLEKLAGNLSLRWESTLDGPSHHQTVAAFMRIYVQQALPGTTLVSARL